MLEFDRDPITLAIVATVLVCFLVEAVWQLHLWLT